MMQAEEACLTLILSSVRLTASCCELLQVKVEMEDNAIPEEYFTCHGDKLFDLLASSLADFAKRNGRCASCYTLIQVSCSTSTSGAAPQTGEDILPGSVTLCACHLQSQGLASPALSPS